MAIGVADPLITAIQLNYKRGDSAEWHMEWGAAGTCAIINRKGNYGLTADHQDQVILKKGLVKDNLVWRIVPAP